MELGSTQPITEISIRNLTAVKSSWRVRLKNSRCLVRLAKKCGNIGVSQMHGPPQPIAVIAFLEGLCYMELAKSHEDQHRECMQSRICSLAVDLPLV
jgi:hypothetical protein